jgi:hypothetical protein
MNAYRERAHLFKAFFLMLKKGCAVRKAAIRGEHIVKKEGLTLRDRGDKL